MTEYDNKNRGALFKNEDKKTDKHPDYRGPINVQGVDMELAAWLKTSKGGKKYMQLKIGPKWEPKQDNRTQPAQRDDFEDSDIPF